MLQRIQSIYLFASAAIMTILLFTPILNFQDGVDVIQVGAFKIIGISGDVTETYEPISVMSLAVAIILIVVLSVVDVFLFKNRSLQIKITRYNMLIKVLILGVLAYFIMVIKNESEIDFIIQPQIGLFLIPIALILDWLAIKGIKKDENLIKSVDRIR